jgi:hypothetical protein
VKAVKWNQVGDGNAHVSDGVMTFWATFPRGTSAKAVLEAYMSTADYSGSTKPFRVVAEIDGHMASTRVQP